MGTTRNVREKYVMARVMRQNIKHQEDFTLKKYGTWEKAEEAAREWEEKLKDKLPDKLSTKGVKTNRNSSGVVGVRLDKNIKCKKNGSIYEYLRWIAFWPNCPLKGGIGWSINKFGDDNAFVLAVISRNNESVDRKFIVDEFYKLQQTEEYSKVLNDKSISLQESDQRPSGIGFLEY